MPGFPLAAAIIGVSIFKMEAARIKAGDF